MQSEYVIAGAASSIPKTTKSVQDPSRLLCRDGVKSLQRSKLYLRANGTASVELFQEGTSCRLIKRECHQLDSLMQSLPTHPNGRLCGTGEAGERRELSSAKAEAVVESIFKASLSKKASLLHRITEPIAASAVGCGLRKDRLSERIQPPSRTVRSSGIGPAQEQCGDDDHVQERSPVYAARLVGCKIWGAC